MQEAGTNTGPRVCVYAVAEPHASVLTPLIAPRDDTSPPLLYAALAVGSVNDRVWVDGGELGLWTGTGTRALTLTPTTPEALRAVLNPR